MILIHFLLVSSVEADESKVKELKVKGFKSDGGKVIASTITSAIKNFTSIYQ